MTELMSGSCSTKVATNQPLTSRTRLFARLYAALSTERGRWETATERDQSP